MTISYRTIDSKDNEALSRIIKASLIEYNSATAGTVFTDESTNHLSTTFQSVRSCYFVAIENKKILGGAGINVLPGAEDNVCELQRMFLLPSARNKGIGKQLMKLCLEFAKSKHYEWCYLETFPALKEAIQLYEKTGFKYIEHAIGSTGHFACTTRMIYDLKEK